MYYANNYIISYLAGSFNICLSSKYFNLIILFIIVIFLLLVFKYYYFKLILYQNMILYIVFLNIKTNYCVFLFFVLYKKYHLFKCRISVLNNIPKKLKTLRIDFKCLFLVFFSFLYYLSLN